MKHSSASFWASVITFTLIVAVLYVFVNVGFIAGVGATFLFVCIGLIGSPSPTENDGTSHNFDE